MYIKEERLSNEGHDHMNMPTWEKVFCEGYSPLILFLLSAGLSIASILVVVTVRRYFDSRLKEEACRVQTINIVFTSAFITRGIIYIVTHE